MPTVSLAAVHAAHVSFAYSDDRPVFDDISFSLTQGWTGVVGGNGAGKTTLLRLIAGELLPTAGRLRFDPADTHVAWVRQDVADRDARIDRLAGAGDPGAYRLRAGLGLDVTALERWSTLSPGERRRWQLGAALHAEPDVLLLDEPADHLDAPARAWLIASLQAYRGTGLIVSHDRVLLDVLVTRVLRLHDGTLRSWGGGYSQARAAWEGERRDRLREQVRLREEHQRQRRLLDRQRRDTEAAARERRAGRRMKTIHDHDQSSAAVTGKIERSGRSLGRRAGVLTRRTARAGTAAGSATVERDLGRSFTLGHARPDRPWLLETGEPVILPTGQRVRIPAIDRDDRIRLSGPNGAGKTSLIGALLGRLTLPPGRVFVLPQETTEADGIAALAAIRRMAPASRGHVLGVVAGLGVDPSHLLASACPSPGEARKLLLAQGLGTDAWLLVLDEPENHLDLPSVERLEAALAAYAGALVLVSHDDGLAAAATRTEWRLGPDGLT